MASTDTTTNSYAPAAPALSTTPRPRAPILWRVASLHTRGLATLEYIIVHGEDSGAEVMGLIREKFKKTKTMRVLNLTFLFREQAVLEAEIRAVKHSST
jgi:hypothetical protein